MPRVSVLMNCFVFPNRDSSRLQINLLVFCFRDARHRVSTDGSIPENYLLRYAKLSRV
jgi:hypothetical protein